MDNPNVPAWVFRYLGLGRTTHNLADDTLAELLKRLSIKPDGLLEAIDVLHMHMYDNPNPVGPQVTKLARSMLASVLPNRSNRRLDHELGRLVGRFLSGDDGETAARELLASARKGFEDYSLTTYDMTETLAALFEVQPRAALDILVGDGTDEVNTYIRRHALAGGRRSSALSKVSIDALITWCQEGSPARWVRVAPLLPAFEPGTNEGNWVWSEKVLTLVERAPEPIEVAKSLVRLIEPTSWSGSRSEAIKQRLPLLDGLARALGPAHTGQIALWRSAINKTIERETRREAEEHRDRDERFE